MENYSNTMTSKYEVEEHEICIYAYDNYLEYKLIDDKLYVVTDMGYWKITYLPDWDLFALYHGNTIPSDIDPEKYTDADYHFQRDFGLSKNILSLIIYLKRHDDFRCRLIEQVESMPRRTKKQRARYNRVKQKQQEYKRAVSMQMIKAYVLANAS
jgi:hypothetical protein